MNCYCCNRAIPWARKVKLRPWRNFDPRLGGPDSPAYQSFKEEMTFRWAVICQACYSTLDSTNFGLGQIGAVTFNLAGASQCDKATTIDTEQYRRFRTKEAAKIGLGPEDAH